MSLQRYNPYSFEKTGGRAKGAEGRVPALGQIYTKRKVRNVRNTGNLNPDTALYSNDNNVHTLTIRPQEYVAIDAHSEHVVQSLNGIAVAGMETGDDSVAGHVYRHALLEDQVRPVGMTMTTIEGDALAGPVVSAGADMVAISTVGYFTATLVGTAEDTAPNRRTQRKGNDRLIQFGDKIRHSLPALPDQIRKITNEKPARGWANEKVTKQAVTQESANNVQSFLPGTVNMVPTVLKEGTFHNFADRSLDTAKAYVALMARPKRIRKQYEKAPIPSIYTMLHDIPVASSLITYFQDLKIDLYTCLLNGVSAGDLNLSARAIIKYLFDQGFHSFDFRGVAPTQGNLDNVIKTAFNNRPSLKVGPNDLQEQRTDKLRLAEYLSTLCIPTLSVFRSAEYVRANGSMDPKLPPEIHKIYDHSATFNKNEKEVLKLYKKTVAERAWKISSHTLRPDSIAMSTGVRGGSVELLSIPH